MVTVGSDDEEAAPHAPGTGVSSAEFSAFEVDQGWREEDRAGSLHPVPQVAQHPIANGLVLWNYRVILTVAMNNVSRIHETVDGKAFRNALGDIHFTAGRNVNTFLSKGEISLYLGVL